MPRGEIYNREEMGSWIKQIREKTGMTPNEFGAACVRFKDVKGKLEIATYKRVSVSYWESGQHLPTYPETIVSLACMEYDLQHPEGYDSKDRVSYVTEKMKKYLGRGLYCKNFTDLLIIYAARGVIKLLEVPDIYNSLIDILLGITPPKEGLKSKFGLVMNTSVLFEQLMKLETIEEVKEEVMVNHSLYSIGYRVVGERLQKLYDSRYKEINGGLEYYPAIRFYAPSYKDSAKKLSSYEVIVSRRFLIDLCLKLHFSRKDINKVLANAQYMPLSEDSFNLESVIREYPDTLMGTAPWFALVENQVLRDFHASLESLPVIVEESDFPGIMFPRLRDYSWKEKLIYLLAIGIYILLEEGNCPVPYYVFDYCLIRSDMRKLLAQAGEAELDVKKERDALIQIYRGKEVDQTSVLYKIYVQLKKQLSEFHRKMENPARYHQGYSMQELSLTMNDEYENYFDVDSSKLSILMEESQQKKRDRYLEETLRLKYFSAMAYTCLTGFLYKGSPDPEEMAFFQKNEDYPLFLRRVMGFIWNLMLVNAPVYPGEHGGILIKENDPLEVNLIRILLELSSFLSES